MLSVIVASMVVAAASTVEADSLGQAAGWWGHPSAWEVDPFG